MKNFMLDNNGDVVIENGKIQMVDGIDLKKQTFRQVIATKIGEWKYNTDEGMNFAVLLKKHYNVDAIEEAIEAAVRQVDEDAEVREFECKVTGRTAEISFIIVTEGQDIYIAL